MASKIQQITKKYNRVINRDKQIWTFETGLSATVEINSKEELLAESTKLFAQAKYLVELDIKKMESEIKPLEINKQ